MAIETKNVKLSPIQNFYSNQSIFITGGTGFLGKVLIEKLLRTCSDISCIYVLIRPKKGEEIEQRIEKILDDAVFERVKREVPKYRHKVVPMLGDCSKPDLGLSEADKNILISDVSIIFHVAATVRFDEKLRDAVAINIGGTKEILQISRKIKNLKCIIHVSTAYSNCNRKDVDEKFYKPPITGDDIIKLVSSLEDDKIDAITPTLLDNFPNTYAYTKCIAEQVVLQYGKDLPVGIYRPAIVISTYKEPLEGWIDNIYGPTGALAGGGAGLIRTMNVDKNCIAELIPADLTVNALIATAWNVANNKNEAAEPPIFNYYSTWNRAFTWSEYMNLAMKYGRRTPTTRSIWNYSVTLAKNPYYYRLLLLLLHFIPALIVDIGLLASGNKPRLLKAYRKLNKFAAVTAFFSTSTWNFSNNNIIALWNSLSSKDKELFFFSMNDFDWDDYMKKCIGGIRLYIFKEDASTIPEAKKRMARFDFYHQIVKCVVTIIGFLLLYKLSMFILSFGIIGGVSTISENVIEKSV
ncbi:fatty acyl-CoA reductase wat-like [Prorops nasuta]|uniref:fatty acyl-CoA reductase wat-like n=1 Tax=Prorops nasuta TaxID=863751 RepID=UPI0034CF8D3F